MMGMSEERRDNISFEFVVERLIKLEERVGRIEGKLDALMSQNKLLVNIIKYVVTPLIVILGALVGVKVVVPSP